MIKVLVIGYWSYKTCFRFVEKRAGMRGHAPDFVAVSQCTPDEDEIQFAIGCPWKQVDHCEGAIRDLDLGDLMQAAHCKCQDGRHQARDRIRIFVDMRSLGSYEAFVAAVDQEIQKRASKVFN